MKKLGEGEGEGVGVVRILMMGEGYWKRGLGDTYNDGREGGKRSGKGLN